MTNDDNDNDSPADARWEEDDYYEHHRDNMSSYSVARLVLFFVVWLVICLGGSILYRQF